MLRRMAISGVLVLAGSALMAGNALAGDAAAGKTVYTTYCVSCHGADGKGDGPVGAVLNPRPRDFSIGDFKYDTDKDGKSGSDADIANIVKHGAAAYGGSPLMAPWATLTDQQLQDVVAYIRSLRK